MTKITKRIVSAVSAGIMLLNMTAPVFAATTLEISGNGADTTNDVTISQVATTTVVQSNNANINNNVDANASTGNNDANRNTGGNVSVDTGDAKTEVSVSNSVNSNTANVDCCASNDTNVLISGNGDNSDNDVAVKNANSTSVYQTNEADVDNDIDANSKTGGNDTDRNTNGDVEIKTGNATTKVDVSNTANANWANVGGEGSDNGSVSLRILDNGADTDNDIVLALGSDVLLTQSNEADVDNDIDADAKTGYNDANRNTGGEVSIDTGDASTDVDVDNAVNFNWADVDCGCLMDVSGKIAGNGDNSENDITASLGSALEVFQDNCGDDMAEVSMFNRNRHDCEVDNDVDADAATGENEADRNTGGSEEGDPAITTGNATSNVDLETAGNTNAYGVASEFEWPDFDFGFNLSLDLDWADLLALLGH